MRKFKDATDAFGRRDTNDDPSLKELVLERKSYSRYFSDYYMIPRADGSGKLDRVYTGPVYQQELSKKERVWIRIIYAVLFVIAVLLFYGSTVLSASSNKEIIIWLCLVPAMAADIFWIMTLYTYICAKADFTKFDYINGAKAICVFAEYNIGAKLIAVAAVIIYMIIKPGNFNYLEIIKTGMIILSAAAILATKLIERSVKYTYIPPKNDIPEDAVKMVNREENKFF